MDAGNARAAKGRPPHLAGGRDDPPGLAPLRVYGDPVAADRAREAALRAHTKAVEGREP